MKIIAAILPALFPTLSLCAGVIEGQVFVASRGGENFKLGDVEVVATDFDSAKAVIEKRRLEAKALNDQLLPIIKDAHEALAQAEAARDKVQKDAWDNHDYNNSTVSTLDDLCSKARRIAWNLEWAEKYSTSALFYIEKLPTAIGSARTDADGKFSLTIPTGKFVLSARARRKIGDSSETYCWLVPIEMTGSSVSVNLANANMACGNNSPLISTINSEDESVAETGKSALVELRKLRDEKIAQENAAKQIAIEEERQKREAFIRQHLPELVKQSQARAAKKYPQLSVAGSSINIKFVAAYKKLTSEKSPRFQEPDWPERLADECAANP